MSFAELKELTVKPPSALLPFEKHNIIIRFLCELVGTAGLTWAACVAPVPDAALQTNDFLPAAFALFAMIIVIVYVMGDFSGANVNPCVTLGLLCVRAIKFSTAIAYWIAQFLGGMLGAFVAWALFPTHSPGYTILAQDVTVGEGIAFECLATFTLVLTVLRVTVPVHPRTPISATAQAAGPFIFTLALLLMVILGADKTGASLNPARTLGAAVIWNVYKDLYIYFVGPPAGAIIAVIAFYILRYGASLREHDVPQYESLVGTNA